ncbi:MAG: hypothetical protein M2R45_03053 [Verrucomicrobia subdivision 3 bacterium]|nr:hypothetical protein [Limisphaerales bacterium]MCS1415574.1 hypothetical protein [Limisphaerales bacterium]
MSPSRVFRTGFAVFFTATGIHATNLRVERDELRHRFSVFRGRQSGPILTQHASPAERPYLHPLVAPGGQGSLTGGGSQKGVFWAFPDLNGRDYFQNSGSDYWRRADADVIQAEGESVAWRTVYDLLDAEGKSVLRETLTWTLRDGGDHFFLGVEWSGEAKTDLTIGQSDYGGLFVRTAWGEGVSGEAVNAARQRNGEADGQRAMWMDAGLQLPGRNEPAHIAVFDHPTNPGFPQRWRVDEQFGFGPVRSRLGSWELEVGEATLVKHQLFVYTGPLNDIEVTQAWSDFSGLSGTWALWGIAQREGREAEFLTPERAIEEMTIQDGFQVNAYAAEPMITQPMAFCWDDRGRMWIAENRDYESRGRGFANSGDSRILILEDTDRDGQADQRSIFSEGIPFPSAMAVGFDGLWLGAPPNLLFLPDRDHDDKVDEGAINIRLTGWGIRDRHETLNSFHWGPDGWLYGCQGFATPSKVGKPAGKGKLYSHRDPFPKDIELDGEGVDINGGVFRYHPLKDRFEVVAHGFSNPWGIDYDAKGQLFISACVIPHLWHVIPGGIYHRQGGQHYNLYVYSDLRTIVDHRHRSAHGGARIYLSDAFPDEYQGKIFMANIHEHAVLTDVLEPVGSGFVAHHGDDFMLANNAQWIGFSVEIGPEGGVYVLDWHDADICGKDVLNKDTGRVFRITPKQSHAQNWDNRYADLSKLPDSELVALQTSKSSWHARRARVILQNRAHKRELAPATHSQLWDIFSNHENNDYQLRALWSLHVTQGLKESQLLDILDHEDQHLRAWAIQFLCEDQAPSFEAISKFVDLANSDISPVVRLYLASALQRMPHDARWAIAQGLVQHVEDNTDHNLPKMIWFAVEPLVTADPKRALTLAAESRLNLVQQFIARRIADAEAYSTLVTGVDEASPQTQVSLLRGFLQGLEGQIAVQAPSNWASLYAKLQGSNHAETRNLATEIAQLFGDVAAAKTMLTDLTNSGATLEKRRQALRGLASQKRSELRQHLVPLLDVDELRIDVIRAMTTFDDNRFTRTLLERYPKFNDDEKLAALQTLSSRSRAGQSLTSSIRDGYIPKRDVPAYIARQLRRVVGNDFVEVWGPIEHLTAEKQAAYAKYRTLLSDAAITQADASQGRAIFNQTCGVCHKMYEDGGMIGPDITGADRTNLDYVLDNILNPSNEIQDDYKLVMITTHDGRSYAGNIAAENDRQLTLRTIGQNVILNQSEIQSREVAPISMMPEGLLEQLSDQEVLNLMAYLRTTQQVPLP